MKPRPVSYEINGFEGMYHSLDGQTPKPEVLWYLQNLIPVNRVLCSRPGFQSAGQVTSAGVSPRGQGLSMFVDGGVERLIAVSLGEIYDVSGTTWTLRVSAANLATAGITLSTSALVYMTQLGEYLHVTDGTNVPFQWNGDAGAGGLTLLTASPVLFGAPTIYYGKLFGIKNTNRQAIVWCEENLLTTGYEAGGYANFWALTQTGGGKLYAIKGTNEALYYWRASNIGAINGEVGPNFQTTGVHDAVSLERGSLSTQTAVAYDGVWFYDDQSRPSVIKGGVVISLWEQVASAIGTSASSAGLGQYYRPIEGDFTDVAINNTLTKGGIAVFPSLDVVIFWYTSSPGTVGVVFHGTTHRALSYFAVDTTAMGSAGGVIAGITTLESTGDMYMLAAGTSTVGVLRAAADIGRQVTQTSDQFGGGGVAFNVPLRFVVGRMGVSRDMNQVFDTLSVETEIETTSIATIGIQYLTSQAQTIATMAAAVTVTPTIDTKQKHVVGIAGYGRWIAPAITVNRSTTAVTAPVRVYGLKVDGFTDAADLSTS